MAARLETSGLYPALMPVQRLECRHSHERHRARDTNKRCVECVVISLPGWRRHETLHSGSYEAVRLQEKLNSIYRSRLWSSIHQCRMSFTQSHTIMTVLLRKSSLHVDLFPQWAKCGKKQTYRLLASSGFTRRSSWRFWAFRLDRDRFLCPFRIRQHRYCLALFDQTRA